MSDDRRDTRRRQRDGELVVRSQSAFPEVESKILEVLERRSQPRRRRDVKQRLVAQWKQTLALSSAATRKLVTDPPPAPKPAPRRPPPKPPNPLRRPGRAGVTRIRQEPVVDTAPVVKNAPVVKTASVAQPVHVPRPTPSRWIPTLPSMPTRIAEVAVQTAGAVLLAVAVTAGTALASLSAPSQRRDPSR